MISSGPEVASFEAEFAQLVDGRHCVAVNSGTSALHLALLAAGVGPGDEVIVPSFTFAATANAVVLAGAVPVFADIEPEYFCLDPDAVEAAVTARTAAVIPVHLYGHPAQMDRLGDIAARRGLLLIEDAAQAHAATVHERPVGSFGAVAAFSFYPTKNMTTGEGGMIVTPDAEVARRARLLRNQGMERRYENEIVGFNTRMTDIAAAIGRVQLRRLAQWTQTRRQNAELLSKSLHSVRTPSEAEGAMHVYHQYTVRADDRDGLRERLALAGVESGVYYPVPVHRLAPFAAARGRDLPETERAAREVLSLPVHPGLQPGDPERIAEAVEKAARP
jgi:dTDP-4-amino-4,6-dideoxygalactose transaminase